jgi:hypothetical protein
MPIMPAESTIHGTSGAHYKCAKMIGRFKILVAVLVIRAELFPQLFAIITYNVVSHRCVVLRHR